MGKMSELSMLLDEVITTGNQFLETVSAVKEFIASSEAKDDAPAESGTVTKIPEKTYSLEEVRELLSRKSNIENGRYRNDVKTLVKKYSDGGTLKNVPTDVYAALIAEAEVIGNA